MSKFLLALGLWAVLLAACTSAAGGPQLVATVAPTSGEALRPVPNEGLPGSDGSVVTWAPTPEYPGVPTLEGYPGVPDVPPTGYPGSFTPAAPGQVDLSQLSPSDGGAAPSVAPRPGRPSDAVTAADGRLLEAAVNDLSAHLDVPTASISLVSVQHVIWSDTSLGCPKTGVDYAQVQVEGSVITLASGTGEYAYHTDGARNFVLCKDGRLISEGVVIER